MIIVCTVYSVQGTGESTSTLQWKFPEKYKCTQISENTIISWWVEGDYKIACPLSYPSFWRINTTTVWTIHIGGFFSVHYSFYYTQYSVVRLQTTTQGLVWVGVLSQYLLMHAHWQPKNSSSFENSASSRSPSQKNKHNNQLGMI